MSLARGKYGVEYNPRQVDDGSSGLGWVVVAVVAVALVSLVCTLIGRYRAKRADEAPPAPVASTETVPFGRPAEAVGPKPVPEPVVEPPPAPKPDSDPSSASKRPARVRNLLMRLEEAEKAKDVEMAVTTIETIRALPGTPAADIDDKLARRLGVLNVMRLFVLRNAQWVAAVVVKRGDSTSRIAAEHGSTLASLAKLNGGNVDKVVVGQRIYVMNHPRFNLVVRRRSRTADLSLNGKFFKRYDLEGDVAGKPGAYEMTERKRALWKDLGIRLSNADRTELEMLLPAKTPVLVSEM